jgi:hypothetical protein
MSDTFQTYDILVAAFLVARGWELVHVEADGGRGQFVFSAQATDDAQEFFKDGRVSAKKFAHSIRDLKAQVQLVGRGRNGQRP